MQLSLGTNIRKLRQRDGRTQENLAEALGVTSQAISRWESCGGYPDMEMLPAIANYFGVTIDELFGYANDREKKIDAILQKIDAFHIPSRSDDEWVDECVALLREGLAEFPQNERLLFKLAHTLSEAGWRRHKEWCYYDEEGFMQHRYDVHKNNPIGSNPPKYANISSITQPITRSSVKRSISSLRFTEISERMKKRSNARKKCLP